MEKKLLSLILSAILCISAVIPAGFSALAADYASTLRSLGFPESYISDLVALHNKHPKWEFKVFNTNLDWETAVAGERAVMHSQQVIETSTSTNNNYYCQCSKCKKNGKYVIQLSPDWVCASEYALKYYMDPRNWLSDKYIFQFEHIAYKSTQTQTGVESIISSTWMKNANITYTNTSGGTSTFYKDGKTVKYSAAILQAAKDSDMSAYYLASKIVQEVGSSSASKAGGSCGTREPFVGIYNYYNIGAYSNATMGLEWADGFLRTNKATTLYSGAGTGTNTAVKNEQYCAYRGVSGDYYKVKLYNQSGSSYSTNGEVGYIKKSDIRTTYTNYGRPWTTPYATIYNGAEYIKDGYRQYQYTGYLQKFNVNSKSSSLYGHEYTTTVAAPSSESSMTYKAYNSAGLLNDAHTFYIPVFKNMPSTKCTVPADSSQPAETPASSSIKLTSRTKESISFSWDKYSGASKYYVYVKNNTTGNTFGKSVTNTSTSISGLNAGNEYYIRVKPYVGSAWKSYYASATYHALPPKVTGLAQSKHTASTFTIKWNKVAGAAGYHIYSYNAKTKKYTFIRNIASGSTTSAVFSSLKYGTAYPVAVNAYIKDTETKYGSRSDVLTATTKPKQVPIGAVSSPSSGKIKVKWTAPKGGVTGYQIAYYRDKALKKKAAEKFVKGKNTLYATGKGFSKGKTYYVRVRAYKTFSGKKIYGAWSTVQKIKVK